MPNSVADFGETAKGLSRNPLGIIALFIVLVYGFACLVVGVGNMQPAERVPLIWFLVVFPFLVLIVFAWLVGYHHKKLYAPADYKDEANFVATIHPALNLLPVAEQRPERSNVVSDRPTHAAIDLNLAEAANPNRVAERHAIYQQSRNLFIAHVLYPTNRVGQEFDIYIYLVRHESTAVDDIAEADFFFGESWGNRVFKATKVRDLIGVRTAAYGPFLCTCHVTFKDGTVVSLHRYIDFEMGRALVAKPA